MYMPQKFQEVLLCPSDQKKNSEKYITWHILVSYFAAHPPLPIEGGVTLHFNIFKFPLPKNTLCQVRLKLVHLFWRRRFPEIINIFIRRYYIPLKNGKALYLIEIESPLAKSVLCQV